MAYQNLVTVNGHALPQPSTYVGLTADLVDAARNAQGVTIGAVIRSDVAKVELEWRYLTVEDWSYVLQLFSPSHGGAFYNPVTFLNQVTGEFTTRTMYVSDRSTGGAFLLDDNTGKVTGWKSPKISLVER